MPSPPLHIEEVISMWDMMRKSMAFGLGAAMLTGDKLKQFVDEAVERGDMNRDEAKKFMEDVTERGEKEKQDMKAWFRGIISDLMKEAGYVHVSRVEALEHRVTELEERVVAAEVADAHGRLNVEEMG